MRKFLAVTLVTLQAKGCYKAGKYYDKCTEPPKHAEPRNYRDFEIIKKSYSGKGDSVSTDPYLESMAIVCIEGYKWVLPTGRFAPVQIFKTPTSRGGTRPIPCGTTYKK